MRNFLRVKPAESLINHNSGGSRGLVKALGALDLTALGVGAIIGTGIFVLTGVGAARYAGPGIILSFVLAAVVAGLAALSYAELASMLPSSGGAYTFTYVSLGELTAWLVGWNLILEYTVAAAAVAVGWGSYLTDLLNSIGLKLPFLSIPLPFWGAHLNLAAIAVTLLVTAVTITGTRESASATKIIVAVKLTVVVLFIALGLFRIHPANWHPFLPFGVTGIVKGAAIVFFAYIGFDAVATAAEEVKNPQKDLPRGITGALILSTVLYLLVAGIMTGMVRYSGLDTPSPITTALLAAGYSWTASFISVGVLAGLTSVLIAVIFAQSRVFFAMSRDGLLPPIFGNLHRRFKTPYISILLVGSAVALLGAFLPVSLLAQMTNIGTLTALGLVSLAVIVLRRTKPAMPRPFKVPLVPYLPIISMVFILYLMISLPGVTWLRFVIWIAIGLVIYHFFGSRRSVIGQNNPKRPGAFEAIVPARKKLPNDDNRP